MEQIHIICLKHMCDTAYNHSCVTVEQFAHTQTYIHANTPSALKTDTCANDRCAFEGTRWHLTER